MKNRKLATVFRWILLIVCGTLLGVNVYSANAKTLVGNKLPMPFGYGLAVVLSGSMEPEFTKGDLIIVKETTVFKEGQIVVFEDAGSLVVHRIIDIDGEKITTKGDANNAADEPIGQSQIKGEMICFIPYFGTVVEFIKTPIGTIIIIAAAILLLEIPRRREKKRDDDELEQIKAEIRKLKEDL